MKNIHQYKSATQEKPNAYFAVGLKNILTDL